MHDYPDIRPIDFWPEKDDHYIDDKKVGYDILQRLKKEINISEQKQNKR
jgi:hypothetical protein